jgi:hypothetical protein
MTINYHAESLAHSLERIAAAKEQEAKELREFATQVREADADGFKDSALHSNVAMLLARTVNNSSWVAALESALHAASELVRGRG